MKIQKILLIFPYIERKKVTDKRIEYNIPTPVFPLGIGYIAAYLQKYGYEVDVIDLFVEQTEPIDMGSVLRWGPTDQEINNLIRESNATLVGISQMFSFLDPICKNIFSIIKEVNPSIVTVWGGTHPTTSPVECLQCADVDYIILGEGERPLKELIENLNSGNDVSGMKSLGYVNGEGRPMYNNQRLWIDDLDNHVLPARQKFSIDKYSKFYKEKTFNMITSRGCPFGCTFCTAPAFYQKRYKGRSPESVVDEMELLVKDYGAELIIVDDENLTSDMKRIEDIMDIMIERDLTVKWYAIVGLSIARLNEDIIYKMKKTGYRELRVAVESGDAQMLKEMKKPLILKQAQNVVQWARKANIKIISFLLFGMPGETIEQMQNTVDFANEIGFDWNIISFVLPLPGTQINRDLVNKGFRIDFTDFERYTSLSGKSISAVSNEELVSIREKANDFLNFENNSNLAKNNVNHAVRDFSELLERYPNMEKCWYHLGLAYYKLGNITDARKAFQTCNKLNSKYKNVSSWIKQIDIRENYNNSSNYLKREIEEELGYSYGHL